VIGESDRVSSTRLWSEESSFRFFTSQESCGRRTRTMSNTSGL